LPSLLFRPLDPSGILCRPPLDPSAGACFVKRKVESSTPLGSNFTPYLTGRATKGTWGNLGRQKEKEMLIHKWISSDGSELVSTTDVQINLTLPYSIRCFLQKASYPNFGRALAIVKQTVAGPTPAPPPSPTLLADMGHVGTWKKSEPGGIKTQSTCSDLLCPTHPPVELISFVCRKRAVN
jgi:hypothetical protein